jgi:hypothetical protein
MRMHIVTTSIALGCLVAAVDLGYHLGGQRIVSVAEGQAGGDEIQMMTAANTQNEVYLFVYNKNTKQITTYMQRTGTGLELKGIRLITSDVSSDIDEYPKNQSPTAVRNMKKLLQQLSKDKEEKEKEK